MYKNQINSLNVNVAAKVARAEICDKVEPEPQKIRILFITVYRYCKSICICVSGSYNTELTQYSFLLPVHMWNGKKHYGTYTVQLSFTCANVE
jgi:hypothetical protein